jgi:RNA polymerase sigma-70 factor (ECF subfamily)
MPTDLATKAELTDTIRRAQLGDPNAFAALFEAHKTRVYSVCLRMTKNVAEAEDLTQEAFMQVFRKLASFRGDSAFSTWLFRIATNTVLMHLRKRSLPQVSLDQPRRGDHGAEPIPREYPSTDLRQAGCVDRIVLSKALADLPAGYHKVFVLHEVDGYEHNEIADLMGCSAGNSKSQLHKARQRIRRFLSGNSKSRVAARASS